MSGDCAVGSFALIDAIIGDQLGGHHSQGTITLRDNVGLDVSVVVLEGQDESSSGLKHLGNQVVDESVLVPEFVGVELLLVFAFEDLLELVLEESVISLQDGVLCSELNGHFSHQCVGENLVREVGDGFRCIVHAESDTTLTFEVENLSDHWFASVGWGEDELKLAGSWKLHILAFILVTIGMSSHDKGQLPPWHQSGDVFADDGFSEHSSVQNGSDGTVRGLPHLLQLELLHPLLIGSDCRALHTHLVLKDSVSSIDGHLIVCLVTVLDPQIIILEVHVHIGKHKTIPDPLPNDPSQIGRAHV